MFAKGEMGNKRTIGRGQSSYFFFLGEKRRMEYQRHPDNVKTLKVKLKFCQNRI